jgi:hypothetical protein
MRATRSAAPSEHRDPAQVNGLGADNAGAGDSPPPREPPGHPIDYSQAIELPEAPGGSDRTNAEGPFSTVRSGRCMPSGPRRRPPPRKCGSSGDRQSAVQGSRVPGFQHTSRQDEVHRLLNRSGRRPVADDQQHGEVFFHSYWFLH